MRNTLILFAVCLAMFAQKNALAQDVINFKFDSLYYADAYYMILIDEPYISESEMEMITKDWEEKRSLRKEEDLRELLDENIIAIDLFMHPTSGVSKLVAFEYDPLFFAGLTSKMEFPMRGRPLASILIDDKKVQDGMMYTYIKALDQMMDWGEEYKSFAHLEKNFRDNEWIPKGYQVLVDSVKIAKPYRKAELREKIGAERVGMYSPPAEKKWYEVEGDDVLIIDRFVENLGKKRIIHTYFLSLNGQLRFFVVEELASGENMIISRGYLTYLFAEKPGNMLKMKVRYSK